MNFSGLCAFLVFMLILALKLTGFITWSWVWVTAPLWIPAILWVVAAVFIIVAFKGAVRFKMKLGR